MPVSDNKLEHGKGPRRILAISSGGGHWVQLLRLRPAFENHRVTYVTVRPEYRMDLANEPFHVVSDGTRWNKFGLARMVLQVAWILFRERPDVIVSTGAAPGYFALRMGRWLGAKTVWLDSIANVDQLSMSGRIVGPYADLWLTQWSHLAQPGGPAYAGSVL